VPGPAPEGHDLATSVSAATLTIPSQFRIARQHADRPATPHRLIVSTCSRRFNAYFFLRPASLLPQRLLTVVISWPDGPGQILYTDFPPPRLFFGPAKVLWTKSPARIAESRIDTNTRIVISPPSTVGRYYPWSSSFRHGSLRMDSRHYRLVDIKAVTVREQILTSASGPGWFASYPSMPSSFHAVVHQAFHHPRHYRLVHIKAVTVREQILTPTSGPLFSSWHSKTSSSYYHKTFHRCSAHFSLDISGYRPYHKGGHCDRPDTNHLLQIPYFPSRSSDLHFEASTCKQQVQPGSNDLRLPYSSSRQHI
jgi:hypothetical protein